MGPLLSAFDATNQLNREATQAEIRSVHLTDLYHDAVIIDLDMMITELFDDAITAELTHLWIGLDRGWVP